MAPAPLAERVEAPAELAPPTAPAGISWRPVTLDDVDAIAELFAAIAVADHPTWSETREEVEEELDHSWVDLERDTLAAFDGDLLVGFGHAIAPPEPETIVRSIALGGVRPSHRGRGIGRELLAWNVARGRQQLAESGLALPGWIIAYVEEANPGASALAERVGLPLRRYFTKLSRDLAEPIPELELPAGLTLVRPTAGMSEKVRAAKNAAFRDHWGSQPTTREQWETALGLSTYRSDLSVLALDRNGAVVGFVIVDVYPDDFERQGYQGGYISLVGVVREWRRRGVAPALLAAALRASRDVGHSRISLDVDSDNPTGALSLYTGMGFTADSRSRAHVLAFD